MRGAPAEGMDGACALSCAASRKKHGVDPGARHDNILKYTDVMYKLSSIGIKFSPRYGRDRQYSITNRFLKSVLDDDLALG
jgi:hypothetical protein